MVVAQMTPHPLLLFLFANTLRGILDSNKHASLNFSRCQEMPKKIPW